MYVYIAQCNHVHILWQYVCKQAAVIDQVPSVQNTYYPSK